MVNPDLLSFLEQEVIPRYDSFDKGHRQDHARTVLSQALELSQYYDVDTDMVATAAAYHDTGLCVCRETHHLESGRIIREDAALRRWFTEEQIETIAQAAEDHRASLGRPPRTIYGRIIAEADRQIVPETVIRRTVQFGFAHYPELDKEGHWQRTLEHMHEKYAEGGYLKLWIPESPNAARMAELRAIIADEAALRAYFEKFYNEENMARKSYCGHIVDVVAKRIFDGEVVVADGRIAEVRECEVPKDAPYIMPGFVDAHVHVESSMVLPVNFAAKAVKHGTVGAVCDPHEIANVLGMDGVRFMLDNARGIPFHFWFGAPSCVPCTNMETAGAELGPKEIAELMQMPDIHLLSEMMFAYGVVIEVPEVMEKLRLAREAGKPIDGHAPGFSGEWLQKYVAAGVSTDHECNNIVEAREKVAAGMKILIREGSAAKNYDALCGLIAESPENVMFCSDDKHPEDLQRGHINQIVKRSLDAGFPFWNVICAATLNPVKHYGMDCGLLQKGDGADFILVDNLTDFNVLATFLGGEDASIIKPCELPVAEAPNQFNAKKIGVADIEKPFNGEQTIDVIEAIDKDLFTGKIVTAPKVEDGKIVADGGADILKIVVYNRYTPSKPAVGFINGFGMKAGALASSVAHDSHNIVAVGASDEAIVAAVNRLIELKGGLVAVNGGGEVLAELALPVAGLMTCSTVDAAAEGHSRMQEAAKALGCKLGSPFMTMSFMCLPVIPKLKITDRGMAYCD